MVRNGDAAFNLDSDGRVEIDVDVDVGVAVGRLRMPPTHAARPLRCALSAVTTALVVPNNTFE